MTVRQVFYQLVARGEIEKTEKEYQQTVIRLLTAMRLDGDISFAWIIDETRRVRVERRLDQLCRKFDARLPRILPAGVVVGHGGRLRS